MRIDNLMDKAKAKKRSPELQGYELGCAIYNDMIDDLEKRINKGIKIDADEEDVGALIRVHAQIKRKINKEVLDKIISDNELRYDKIILKINE